MSNFLIYLIGTAFIDVGVVLTAYKLGAPPIWIGIGAIILTGIGIKGAISKSHQKYKWGFRQRKDVES
jgi:hypothetical protein